MEKSRVVERRAAFPFDNQVVEWIKAGTDTWRPETKSFGDSLSDYLLLQRSREVNPSTGELIKGITVQAIGVDKLHRREGRANRILTLVEETVQERGDLGYILIQSVLSPKMVSLLEKRGNYTLKMYSMCDYIYLLH